MKKFFIIFLVTIFLYGCSTHEMNEIHVYTRDASSGTRDALESGISLPKGELTLSASEVTSNGDMIQQVHQDENAIGYISLIENYDAFGIKPLKYNNTEASKENVLNKKYPLARDFIYMTRKEVDYSDKDKQALVAAFIDYLTKSFEGKLVVQSAGGIVDLEDSIPWSELKKEHPIVGENNQHIILKTGGSTSVEKTINAAMESFIPLAGNFQYIPMHSGSSDGYKRTIGNEKEGPNQIDIGFASRGLKEEEDVSEAMRSGSYAKDAVVLIVHQQNSLEEVSKEELLDIMNGNKNVWTEGLRDN